MTSKERKREKNKNGTNQTNPLRQKTSRATRKTRMRDISHVLSLINQDSAFRQQERALEYFTSKEVHKEVGA